MKPELKNCTWSNRHFSIETIPHADASTPDANIFVQNDAQSWNQTHEYVNTVGNRRRNDIQICRLQKSSGMKHLKLYFAATRSIPEPFRGDPQQLIGPSPGRTLMKCWRWRAMLSTELHPHSILTHQTIYQLVQSNIQQQIEHCQWRWPEERQAKEKPWLDADCQSFWQSADNLSFWLKSIWEKIYFKMWRFSTESFLCGKSPSTVTILLLVRPRSTANNQMREWRKDMACTKTWNALTERREKQFHLLPQQQVRSLHAFIRFLHSLSSKHFFEEIKQIGVI